MSDEETVEEKETAAAVAIASGVPEDEETVEEESVTKVSRVTEFSLELAEIEITLTEKNGDVIKAYLRELVGTERDAYLTGLGNRMKYKGGEVSGFTTFEGHQANLLVLCLYENETDKRFAFKRIQAFPAKVQETLFKMAQEMSGLDLKAEEKAKND